MSKVMNIVLSNKCIIRLPHIIINYNVVTGSPVPNSELNLSFEGAA